MLDAYDGRDISDGGVSDADSPDQGSAIYPDGGSVFTQSAPVQLEWVYSGPAILYFTRTEITVAQYDVCVSAGACTSSNNLTTMSNPDCNYRRAGYTDHPVNCINWHGATEFCEWAGARLPEATEWEAEASNGRTRVYPWGDTPEPNCDHCVMDELDAGGRGCGMQSTAQPCSRPLGNSISGLCDMAGNVYEWTATRQGSSAAFVRGAHWRTSQPSPFEAVSRGAVGNPDSKGSTSGFRCASDSAP